MTDMKSIPSWVPFYLNSCKHKYRVDWTLKWDFQPKWNLIPVWVHYTSHMNAPIDAYLLQFLCDMTSDVKFSHLFFFLISIIVMFTSLWWWLGSGPHPRVSSSTSQCNLKPLNHWLSTQFYKDLSIWRQKFLILGGHYSHAVSRL